MLSPFTVPALEGTAGPVTLNDPVFISDLHLSHSEPDTINAFLRFLEHEAAEHAELLILGDFFDYWIGDDASYTMAAVADALRAYSASHGLYIMHGNRDFMMGERFAREIGATLLRDPAVGVLRGERILLSHGDLWCTFDAPEKTPAGSRGRPRPQPHPQVRQGRLHHRRRRTRSRRGRPKPRGRRRHPRTHPPSRHHHDRRRRHPRRPPRLALRGGELHPRRLDRHRGQSPRSTPHEVTALTERPTAQAFLCTPIAQTAHGS